jgi:hypothetical protein
MRNTKKKNPKQTPPNQDSSHNLKSERHPADSRLPKQSPTQPRKLSQLDANSRTRSKSARPIRIQNQFHQANQLPDYQRCIINIVMFECFLICCSQKLSVVLFLLFHKLIYHPHATVEINRFW